MAAELGRLGAVTIPVEEIASRKAVLIGDFGREVETTGGLAGQLSALAQFGLPLSKLQTYAADIAAVTAEQAAAAAKAHFDPATASLVVVGDAKVFGAKLKAAFPQLQQIALDKLNLDSATLK
jgi:zinc protease